MTVRVAVLAAHDCAVAASEVLTAAWPEPHLEYSPAYLEWQLAFPGAPGAIAVGAYAGDQMIGFAGATPRRVRVGAWEGVAAVVSFLAVQPERRGAGVSTLLFERLLGELMDRGVPVVRYVQEGSDNQQARLRAYARAGYVVTDLGSCPSYGMALRSGATAGPLTAERVPASVVALLAPLPAGGAVASAPDVAQLEHYAAGPDRAVVAARDAEGRLAGAALVAGLEFRSGGQIRRVAAVETVFGTPDAPLLRAAARAAADLVGGAATISFPNLPGLADGVARAAGLRRLTPSFRAYFCQRGAPLPLQATGGTSLEVV